MRLINKGTEHEVYPALYKPEHQTISEGVGEAFEGSSTMSSFAEGLHENNMHSQPGVQH